MKKLISALTCILALTACGQSKGSAPTIVGACTQTAYTNGNRYTCSAVADIVEFAGQAQTIEQVHNLCGLGGHALRLQDQSLVDVDNGTIVQLDTGAHTDSFGCSFNVGSAPTYTLTF